MVRTRPTEEVLPDQREVVLSVLHVQLGRLLRSIAAEVPTITDQLRGIAQDTTSTSIS